MSTPRAPGTGTRPENLASSHKRARGPSVYAHALPLVPVQASLFSLLKSPLAPHQIKAVYDELTGSVTVEGEEDMVLLWRRGFFGKGTLSRSEPSWKRRVENKIAESEGREKKLTAEELTAARRIERKSTKLVKKLEREAEKLAAASAAASEWGSSVGGDRDAEVVEQVITKLDGIAEDEGADEEAEAEAAIGGEADPEADAEGEVGVAADKDDPPPQWHLRAERTQLQPEEAFFLLFSLGMLEVLPSPNPFSAPTKTPLSILQTWATFLSSPRIPLSLSLGLDDPRLNRIDSPFLISYAVYHHYRSMGWVIRSGVKFCADWVLYGPGGPVGGHAEFAVVVVPSYVDPEDAKSSPFNTLAEMETRNSWKWFNTVNRVCSGVKKTLILVHVLIPPIESVPKEHDWVANNPAQAMAKLEIREVAVRRWMAGRMRD
ncbi:tRNA-intron endonuclease [Pseudohyphozyma bogoriensis]|nr:tRNA-intron endonuclease [Pseudohyphozyma bogoriensis]